MVGYPGLDFFEDGHEGRAGAAPIGVDFDHVQGRVAFAFYWDGAGERGGRASKRAKAARVRTYFSMICSLFKKLWCGWVEVSLSKDVLTRREVPRS